MERLFHRQRKGIGRLSLHTRLLGVIIVVLTVVSIAGYIYYTHQTSNVLSAVDGIDPDTPPISTDAPIAQIQWNISNQGPHTVISVTSSAPIKAASLVVEGTPTTYPSAVTTGLNYKVIASPSFGGRTTLHLISLTESTELTITVSPHVRLNRDASRILGSFGFSLQVVNGWGYVLNQTSEFDHHVPLTIGIFGLDKSCPGALPFAADGNGQPVVCTSPLSHSLPLQNWSSGFISPLHGQRAIAGASRLEFYSFWPKWEPNKNQFIFATEQDFLQKTRITGKHIVFSPLYMLPSWAEGDNTVNKLKYWDETTQTSHQTPVLSPWVDTAHLNIQDRYYRELSTRFPGMIDSFVINVASGYGEIGFPGGSHGQEFDNRFANLPNAFYLLDVPATSQFRTRFTSTPETFFQNGTTIATNVWIDALEYYVHSLADYALRNVETIRANFPASEVIVKFGFADQERIRQGNDNGALAFALRNVPHIRFHIPSEFTVEYQFGADALISSHNIYNHDILRALFVQNRIGTVAKHFDIPVQTEAPSQFTNQKARIFEDIAIGAQGRYSYTEDFWNWREFGLDAATNNLSPNQMYRKYARGEKPHADMALYFPTTTHWIATRDTPSLDLPYGIQDIYRQLLRIGATDIIDEYLVRDLSTNTLLQYKIIVLPGTYFIQPETLQALKQYVNAGGKLYWYEYGTLYTPQGEDVTAELFQPPGQNHTIGRGTTTSFARETSTCTIACRTLAMHTEYRARNGIYSFEPLKPVGVYSVRTDSVYAIYNISGTPWTGVVSPWSNAQTLTVSSNGLGFIEKPVVSRSCAQTMNKISTALHTQTQDYQSNLVPDGILSMHDAIVALKNCDEGEREIWWQSFTPPPVQTPAPTPRPFAAPTNLQVQCNATGTQATLSWDKTQGHLAYAIRIDNRSNGWQGTCAGALSGDTCLDNITETSYTLTTSPNVVYAWWLSTIYATAWSQSAYGTPFSCVGATPTTAVTSDKSTLVYRLVHDTGARQYVAVVTEQEDPPPSYDGWTVEGAVFRAYFTRQPGTVPIYTLYNSTTMDFFYTHSANEVAIAEQYGYQQHDARFYGYTSSGSNRIPIYRLVHTGSGKHFYTASNDEKQTTVDSYGYTYEGIGWYAPAY